MIMIIYYVCNNGVALDWSRAQTQNTNWREIRGCIRGTKPNCLCYGSSYGSSHWQSL